MEGEPASAAEEIIAKRQRVVSNLEDDQAAVLDFDVPWEPFRSYAMHNTPKPNYYSRTFKVGEFVWKLLFTTTTDHPQGHPQHFLSVFLDNTHVKDAQDPWQCACIFKFELIRGKPQVQDCSDMFTFFPNNKGETDRGYLRFAKLDAVDRAVTDSEDGQIFTVRVSVKDMQTQYNRQHTNADTRAATGYVGLKNQGATCYLNSFLQTLFHLPAFRSATYRLPASLEKSSTQQSSTPSASSRPSNTLESSSGGPVVASGQGAKKGVAFNIAKLFYRMQTQAEPPRTTELTESFGWTRVHTLEQHDIEELARILLENLETKMKGTADEKTIGRLFTGKQGKFIKCRDVDYSSESVDTFQDIHLRVRDCDSLLKSLEMELKKEELAGENKYHCVDKDKGIDDRYDADMGTEFLVLPPVLVMHLRRFEFNLKSYQLEKVNGYFEFPMHLDMSPYLRTESGPVNQWEGPVPTVRSDLSDEEWDAALAGARDQKYRLHSVLVHSGHMHGGHYQAYISPNDGSKWFKFDDTTVAEVSKDCAVTDHFGGKNETRFWLEQSHKDTSAYMLLYVRDDMWDSICSVSADVPADLESEFRAEDEATREASRHIYFAVYTVEDIAQHVRKHEGLGLLPTTVQHDRPTIPVEKDSPDVSHSLAQSQQVPNAFWFVHNGVPVNSPNARDAASLQRLCPRRGDRSRFAASKSAPIQFFKVPVEEAATEGDTRVVVFVKEYVPAPAGKGRLLYSGHVFVRPVTERQELVDTLAASLFPKRQGDACDIYTELPEEGKVDVLPATLLDGTILVVSWPQGSTEALSPVIDQGAQFVPSAEEVRQAEAVTGKELGIDRSNIFRWRHTLHDLASDAGVDIDTLKQHLNIVWQVKEAPTGSMTVIDYYKVLQSTRTYHFYELRDDGRRSDAAPILRSCPSTLTHAQFVQEIAPSLRHPPANIRLWTLTGHGRKECMVPEQNPLHKQRGLEGDIGYELLNFPLSLLKDEEHAEMRIPFLSPKLKVLATLTILVRTTQTVEEVLAAYRQQLSKKISDERDMPKPEDELILVRLRESSRIDSVVSPHLEVKSARHAGGTPALSWDCRVEVKTPLRAAPQDVAPENQLLVRITLIDIRDNRVYFHGTPFLLYVLPGETCEDIINAASARLCLTAEMKTSNLYSLQGDVTAVVVSNELEKSGSTDAYDYLRRKREEVEASQGLVETDPYLRYLPSLGVEKKRVHSVEKPIKIHN
eukprot:TRINITY_DN6147_c0_g4_i1.p1 TRINITY_DN6147_c0_g4~~TRINITY_DN6147_c0_g4_i1.p1  ORF type:complete len:1226 (+),score=433.69 TRINITY_DN6147_c0_g4_i1:192-3869(+)